MCLHKDPIRWALFFNFIGKETGFSDIKGPIKGIRCSSNKDLTPMPGLLVIIIYSKWEERRWGTARAAVGTRAARI